MQVPQSWDKSIFYQTREVRRSLAGDERQGNLRGASRGKRLRSEPLDSAKCSSVIFCYEYTWEQTRKLGVWAEKEQGPPAAAPLQPSRDSLT